MAAVRQEASMSDREEVSNKAVSVVTRWLESKRAAGGRLRTLSIQNVEKDPYYQKMDVDLICETERSGKVLIEVKGDRHTGRTRNFFFETVSNLGKRDRGCFMYTKADWLFYYAITSGELFMLPMPQTREWFLAELKKNRGAFGRDVDTGTCDQQRNHLYTTRGKLVNVERVLRSVPNCRVIKIPAAISLLSNTAAPSQRRR